jgi:multiple antibiotic resistance protein
LLAIINPLEALPVFLKLLEGEDANQHWQVARRSCLYAMLLLFFFFVFGTLILRIFGVSLSMVRIVGGIIPLRIGFELFSGSSSGASMIALSRGTQFVPLAMPLMCGPGAIATMLGMTSPKGYCPKGQCSSDRFCKTMSVCCAKVEWLIRFDGSN